MSAVESVEEVKKDRGIGYRPQTRENRIPYATLQRWRSKIRKGEPVLRKTGPRKPVLFDENSLFAEIGKLSNGVKRTNGTGSLYGRWRWAVSRREFRKAVARIRRGKKLRRQAYEYIISWLVPNMVWATDESRCFGKILLSFQDLASRYKFDPKKKDSPFTGEEVAKYLDDLCKIYGPPLFLKSDGGKNLLKCLAVQSVMNHWGILPLVSPRYYPKYNGGIERAQGEIKAWIREHDDGEKPVAPLACDSTHALNHKPRASLAGDVSCTVFFDKTRRKHYGKIKRREVRKWILDKSSCIMSDGVRAGRAVSPEAAWRQAAQIWLVTNGGIVVTPKQKSVTPFSEKLVS